MNNFEEATCKGIMIKYIGNFSDEELSAYVDRGLNKLGHHLKGIKLTVDPDDPEFVNIEYDIKHENFQRLRRITGYLVGTLDRWNNAKRAEEGDRVKHD